MMRRLVAAPPRHPAARHRREHLARHHLDLHLRAGAVFGACRYLASANPRCGIRRGFISASPCPTSRISAPQAAVEAVAKSKGDLALVLGHLQPHAVVDRAGGRRRPEDHRAAAVHRARRPSGGAAGVRGVARRRQRHGDRGRDVERAGVGLERRDRARAVAAGRNRRRARYRLRRRRAAGVGRPRAQQPRKDQIGPDRGRRLGALLGPRRQPCNALYGAPERRPPPRST